MMKKIYSSFTKYLFVIIVSLGLSSCDESKKLPEITAKPDPNLQRVPSKKIIKIDFIEEEKGIDPYKVRLVVSQYFLRFDDGVSSSGFILYDRVKNIIHNVSDDDKTVMEIHAKRKSVFSPIKILNKDKKIIELTDAPKINNVTPIKYDFFTNDKLCLGIVAVKGMLPMATNALREYLQALSDDSTYTLNNIPTDMHDGCSLAMNTFSATRHLQYGFPIQLWNPKGYSRALVGFDDDFKNVEKLFSLPENYKTFTVDELRTGTVAQ